MLFANDCNDKRVHIDATHSNQTYYCPFCGVPLITKKGEIRQHHFAHSASHRCSDSWENNRSYDMSPWHNEWQSLFPKANQEIKLALGETKHRADVMIGRTVIEFQHSIMPVKAFDDRNNFYFNLGYKVIWLFDLSDLYRAGDLSYQKIDGILHFKWNNPKKAFNGYDVKSGCIDLFFQLTEDTPEAEIIRVLDVSENGFEEFTASQLISKEDFLRYVGFADGVCALPARDDLEKNKQYNEFCQKYGIELNKQQERAVQAVEGANLLLAVPGSGKTTVLIARLGHMIFNKGIDPKNILAITFSKKAAEEMKERFINKFGAGVGNQVKFSTINALCYAIYRRYCKNYSRNAKNLIADKERKRVLFDTLKKYQKEVPTENERLELEQALAYIKNMMLDNDELAEISKSYPNIMEMYHNYQRELETYRMMDYDDQLIFALDILRKESDVLTAFTAQYKYICVDEAQDTSKIQHAIIKLISRENNLFMVGDEDQSIYGFRGAYPKALLNFRYEYTNPYIMRMERNYRSTAQIVEKAQSFISANKGRYEKNMTSERGPGEDVHLIQVTDREEQYAYLLQAAKSNARETAYLYRDNESSIVLIDSFLREHIPFRLKSPEMNFFNTRVIRDILAYLKLALDDQDYESLKCIRNKGIFYLEKQQLDFAIGDCKKLKLSIYDALEKQMQYVKREYRDRAENLKSTMKSIASLPPFDAICLILDRGYGKHIKEKHYDSGKIEILKILAKKESTIKSFLNRIRFLENEMEKSFETDTKNPIVLSTIHSSKGLEYDTVFMLDVYDGRFPSSMPNLFSRSKDNADGEQEERRIFYVGITRAKNRLNLFTMDQKPSSFIEELFPEIAEKREEKRRLEAEEERKRYFEQQRIEWAREQARRNAELQARRILEEEARRKKEEEERVRQKMLENQHRCVEQRCYDEVLRIIDQQDYPARDSFNRRWIRCEKCGEIKQEKEFSVYGGKEHVNLGICFACSRKK